MTVRRTTCAILAVALPASAFLLAAIAGWVLLAMALGAGLVGMALMAALVVSPCLVVALQLLRMSPANRAPLQVPISDGACPRDGRGCGGVCIAERLPA